MKMSAGKILPDNGSWPKLANFPQSAKVLLTATILIMGIALLGALGQIIIHDIIPTFFAENMPAGHMETEGREHGDQAKDAAMEKSPSGRGDLFSDLVAEEKEPEKKSFYKDEQFVWLLRWTHIHLFGMNMIFIFMGAVALFLDIHGRTRTWLVVLPFIGVLVDIGAMWLKTYISPIFFLLHMPGGGLFMIAYMVVSVRALWEMWSQTATDRAD